MTCYFRWMEDTFERIEIDVSKKNKEEIDKAIHSITNVEYKNCSAAWKKAKEMISEDEKKFIEELEQALK